MNSEEKKLLVDFLEQLKSVRGIEKHGEAAALIEEAVRQQPDASYLLVQKSLLQNQALSAAQTEIATLRREIEEIKRQSRSDGFLSSNPWSSSPPLRAPQPMQPSANAPSPGFGGVSATPSSGFGSFLGSMAATAAGVAGGAFLFQGIENMLGHHSGGYGMGDAGYLGEHGAENITVNQYYGDSAAPGYADASYDAGSAENVSNEDSWDLYDDQGDSIDL